MASTPRPKKAVVLLVLVYACITKIDIHISRELIHSTKYNTSATKETLRHLTVVARLLYRQPRRLLGHLQKAQLPTLPPLPLSLSPIVMRRPCHVASVQHMMLMIGSTYHLIWNLVTLGFELISLTSLSNWILSGGVNFISSLSYSVYW